MGSVYFKVIMLVPSALIVRQMDERSLFKGNMVKNRNREHDVNGRRQTAKITSDFESFSSKP